MQKHCPYCKRKYSRGKDKYNTPLMSAYIREKGKNWTVVGWYCPDCERLYGLKDKRLKEDG